MFEKMSDNQLKLIWAALAEVEDHSNLGWGVRDVLMPLEQEAKKELEKRGFKNPDFTDDLDFQSPST